LKVKIVSCLVLIAILLTACQSAASESIAFMVFGDPAEIDAYQKIVNAFNVKYPEIDVELITIPSQSDYRNRLAADIAAGAPADVVLINYRRVAGFADKGALEALDDYAANSKQIALADFYPQTVDAFRWNDHLMCIPQNISSLVVYYNKDLFTQAGVPFPSDEWTWDEFLSAAITLTQDVDGDSVTDQFGVGVSAEMIRLAPFIWQADGDIVDIEDDPSTLMLDTDEAFDAAEFFFGLQTTHHVVPNKEQEASEDSESRFINGRAAMYFNSRRTVPTFRESAQFDWDVAALPQFKSKATILHADGYCIPSASKNKDAAWKLIEFANSFEGQTIIAATGRTVPSRIDVANSPAFLDPNVKPANSKVFIDMIPFIRALPLHPRWVEIEEIATEEIERGFYGDTDVYDAMLRATERSREYFGMK
jgi:multiple sugar transport system substrate-binding protein